MKDRYTIRFIDVLDAPKALEVYAPYVRNTAISFEYDVPTAEAFTDKIKKITAQYPWLVCEYNGEIVGYAYGSTHRDRTAYQWSPEVTVYLDERFHRKGIAKVLYTALFGMLRLQGYYNVFAGVLVTNKKSVAFHKAVGFEEIGSFRNIGYKLGDWHTNLWLQHNLQECKAEPAKPIPINELTNKESIDQILSRANEAVNVCKVY